MGVSAPASVSGSFISYLAGILSGRRKSCSCDSIRAPSERGCALPGKCWRGQFSNNLSVRFMNCIEGEGGG